MTLIVSVINSLLVFLVAAYFSFFMAKNQTNPPLISWSLLAISLVYGAGALIVFTSTADGIDYYGSHIVLNNSTYWPIHGFSTLVLMGGIILGWKIRIAKKSYIQKYANNLFNISDRKFFLVACFLLILGLFLRWLYVKAFGGFIGYLDYNRAIRSSIFELKNPFSFLQPFGYLVILSSYFFWALWLKSYRPSLVFFWFALSFIFSLYIYYSYAGRVGFALYLSSFVLAYLCVKSISPKIIILLALISFPLMSLFIYFISNYFGLKGDSSPIHFFIKEISFVYTSFFAQLADGDLYRLFLDFVMAPVHLLPSSWSSGLYETVSQANTILISGAKKGEQGVTGGIPVDLLTLSIMQVGILGVFPVGVLFGLFIRRLDYFISLIPNKPIRSIMLSYVSLRIAFIGLLYSQPAHFVSGLFPLILLFIILFTISIIKRTKIAGRPRPKN